MTYHTFESVEQDAKLTTYKKNPIYSEMSLRDYFAAKAMQGVISATEPLIKIDEQHLAMWSYKMANAMLKAREA